MRRGDAFLVLHRAPSGGSYWHGVAGALEAGESFAQAAARELLEETGLAAEPVEIAEPYAYPLDADPDQRVRLPPGTTEVVVHTFLVDAPPDWEPLLDDEHDEYRWCSREEALQLLHWPEPRKVLRSLA